MRWSWRIGRLAGIDVFVHATFLILLTWIALVSYQRARSVEGAVAGVLFILLLFGIVVLHELGHALTARRFGIRTRDIILLPIGGVARLDHMPEDPRQELWIALAGPAVNVALAALCFLLIIATGAAGTETGVLDGGASLLQRLLWINVILAAFNLIPAFPMDGGRVLRAALALRLDYVRATAIATRVGQGFALLFGVIGLFGTNPLLVFIALFVWMGAAAEVSATQSSSLLAGVRVGQVMVTELRTLQASDPLSRAAELVLAGFQSDFPVLEGDRVVGVLGRAELMRVLAERGLEAPVSSAMRRDVPTTEPSAEAERVLPALRECRCALPVLSQGRLVGLLTLENVSEFLMLETAVRSGVAADRPTLTPGPDQP